MLSISLFACAYSPSDTASPTVDVAGDTSGLLASELDLGTNKGVAEAFARTRGSLDATEEVVFYWFGQIYDRKRSDPTGDAESEYASPILRFEGFNIGRFEQTANREWEMLTREITVYQDNAGRIIDCFDNGKVGAEAPEQVRVVHVQNDPVNHVISGADFTELPTHVAWNLDVLLKYASPLPVETYPEHSAGNTYETMELFDFFVERSDLEDRQQLSVPAHLSWTRVGQYLPWMKMGQQEGRLVYHAQGFKVMDGYEGLPDELRDWVEDNAPAYQHAPETWGWGENMTSWRYFEELASSGSYDSACD